MCRKRVKAAAPTTSPDGESAPIPLSDGAASVVVGSERGRSGEEWEGRKIKALKGVIHDFVGTCF